MYAPTLEEILSEAGVLSEWTARWEARGEARGEAQGKARGKAEGRAEIAQDLLAKGMPIEEIVQVTGLPYEKILALG